MKEFTTRTGTYFVEVIEITEIPIEPKASDKDNESRYNGGKAAALDLITDLYALCDGDAKLSCEFLRVAEDKQNKSVKHVLVLRSFDQNKNIAGQMMAAAAYAAKETLLSHGYSFQSRDFSWFADVNNSIDRSSCFALCKDEIVESDTLSMGSHISIPVIAEDLDINSVYPILLASGCSISIQITPDRLSHGEERFIQTTYADSVRAGEGGSIAMMHMPKDAMARFGQERWQIFVQSIKSNIYTVNILVMGSPKKAALLIAKLKSKFKDRFSENVAAMCCLPISASNIKTVYDYTWRCERAVDIACSSINFNLSQKAESKNLMRRYTAQETCALLELPYDDGSFKGISSNAFSFIRYDAAIPKEMRSSNKAVLLGKNRSGESVYLNLSDFLLHVSVFGKTGVGKTTALLSIIEQLEKNGVNVMILEPIKSEYRGLTKNNSNTKIFTVESDILPFVLNPFRVPEGVTLDEYRPHLLSAFNAAFSMPDPLPSLFGKAISEAYALYGWKGYSKSDDKDVKTFGLREFSKIFKRIVNQSNYSGEVKGNMMSGGTFRLLSLLDRGKKTFDNVHSINVKDLLNGNVVLELNRLEAEQKCLVTALTLISVLSYLRTTRQSGSQLKNVLILDEAHVLLDNGMAATEEGKNINMSMTKILENLVVEIRALGVGVIIADQSPDRVGDRLLNSTNTKILFRLTGEDAKKAAASIGLSENEAEILPNLDTGCALVSNHRLVTPLGITAKKSDIYDPSVNVSDHELFLLQRHSKNSYKDLYRPFNECSFCSSCSERCIYKIREMAYSIAIQMYNTVKIDFSDKNAIHNLLLAIPRSIKRQGADVTGKELDRLCECAILQFYFLLNEKKDIYIRPEVLKAIINKDVDEIRKEA